jgi:hypothetical protein
LRLFFYLLGPVRFRRLKWNFQSPERGRDPLTSSKGPLFAPPVRARSAARASASSATWHRLGCLLPRLLAAPAACCPGCLLRGTTTTCSRPPGLACVRQLHALAPGTGTTHHWPLALLTWLLPLVRRAPARGASCSYWLLGAGGTHSFSFQLSVIQALKPARVRLLSAAGGRHPGRCPLPLPAPPRARGKRGLELEWRARHGSTPLSVVVVVACDRKQVASPFAYALSTVAHMSAPCTIFYFFACLHHP